MPNYVESDCINILSELRNEIFSARNSAFKLYGIDLLDNDVLSSISLYQIVKQYDADFNVNFARNGEDGISNEIVSEHKCSNVRPKKNGDIPYSSFQFHAMGKLNYPRYIFFVRNKETLEIVRLYDISRKSNVLSVFECLENQSESWLAEGKLDKKKMKRDVIYVKETFLHSLTLTKQNDTINGCEVYIG